MKIKITALIMAFVLILSVGAQASFGDVKSGSDVDNAIIQLSNLGIINGYGDGNFYPDNTLTRAQFAKIAVCMLGEEQKASSLKNNTVFSDVPADSWASGYVNHIAQRGIINGYPDGSFGVNDILNYAQALTILVRLLGYSGEDVGYKWPDGYVSLAESLGITKNMSFDTYESVTRGNAAYIVYNALLAEKKSGSNLALLSQTSVDDVVIYGDGTTDASLSDGSISTTNGVYKLAASSNISTDVYGYRGTLYLDSEKRATAFVAKKENVKEVTLVSAALNSASGKVEITYTEGFNERTEIIGMNAPLYYKGSNSTLERGISQLEAGIEARLFYTEGGVFERMYLMESSIEGPLTITSGYSQVYSSFSVADKNALTVIRDGKKSTVEKISLYDVVYYMRSTNTVYAYSDKISGTYQEAYPFKSSVTSVLVGGREYALSTQKAIRKMNESDGAFALGDRVTLLFGRNGEVVDVVDMSNGGVLDIAVLTECYSEVSSDAATSGEYKRYIKLVLSDGSETSYETDADYTKYIGSVVKMNYSGEKVKLSAVTNTPIYGAFNASVPSLDSHWLANNCTILELVQNNGKTAVVKKIGVHEIQFASLTRNQVIHATTSGSMNDITFLYVTDVTKSGAQFGIVTDVETRTTGSGAMQTSQKQYTVTTDAKTVKVTTALALSKGSAVEVVENTDGTSLKALIKVGSGTKVTGFATGRIRVGSSTYLVSDYVKVYGGRLTEDYHSMSVSELVDNDNVTNVTLYSDRSLASGGVVRMIVVRLK